MKDRILVFLIAVVAQVWAWLFGLQGPSLIRKLPDGQLLNAYRRCLRHPSQRNRPVVKLMLREIYQLVLDCYVQAE
jgi:hypothetical protein